MSETDVPYTFAIGGRRSEDEERAELTKRLRAAYTAKFEAMSAGERVALLVDVAEALDSLGSTFSGDPRDWAEYRRDAWAFGIVNGWPAEPEEPWDDDGSRSAMESVQRKHGWSPALVERLTRYGQAVERLTDHPDLWPDHPSRQKP